MSREDVRDRVAEIMAALGKARDFVGTMSLADFAADDKTLYAVIRALEIAGEAAKRVPEATRAAHPAVPGRSLTGMRDKLIHDYIGVNSEVVWRTAVDEIPPVLAALAAISPPPDKGSPT